MDDERERRCLAWLRLPNGTGSKGITVVVQDEETTMTVATERGATLEKESKIVAVTAMTVASLPPEHPHPAVDVALSETYWLFLCVPAVGTHNTQRP